MSNLSKFVSSVVLLLFMALATGWELFLFVLMRDPAAQTIGGGKSHLLLAALAGLTAFAAGTFVFYFSSNRQQNGWPKIQMVPSQPALDLATLNSSLPALLPFDPVRWALANPWLTEGQADDRIPMNGSAADSGETAPGQRAFARRNHQLMFKKWSQARHD